MSDVGTGLKKNVRVLAEKLWREDEFRDWMKTLGNDPKRPPIFFEGNAGRVYFFEKTVIKISVSPVETRVADFLCQDPTYHFLEVRQFEECSAIFSKRLDLPRTPKEIKRSADLLMTFADNFPVCRTEGFPPDCYQKVRKEFSHYPVCPVSFQKVLERHGALFEKTGYFHDDGGYHNVGLYQDRVVFTDLGPNRTIDLNEEKILETIDNTIKNAPAVPPRF